MTELFRRLAISRVLVLDLTEEIFEHYLDVYSNPITPDTISALTVGHRAVHEHHFDGRPYDDDLGTLLNAYADEVEWDQLRRDYQFANERRKTAANTLVRPASGWNADAIEAFVASKMRA